MSSRRAGRADAIVARVALAAFVLVVLVVLPGAGRAGAHDVLRSTTPAEGATVQTVPDEIVLTFDQPALAVGTALVVRAPDGRDVAAGPPRLVDSTVRQRVGGELPAGSYTVLWRVTSADGHVVTGQFTFAARLTGSVPIPVVPDSSPDPGPVSSPWPAILLGGVVLVLVAAVAAIARRRGDD